MRIAITTTPTDSYALPATVMIRSVVDNLQGMEGCDVYVLDCGLSAKSRMKMERSIPRAWAKLHFIPVSEETLSGFRVDSRFSPAVYARLFLDRFLPVDLTKVIYMDCDLVALSNVRHLWDMDLQDHPLAAVQDPVAGLVGQSAQMMHWDGWGVPVGTKIFNAGLLVIDLCRWRDEKLFECAIRVARENPDRMRWHDQDALNYAICGNYLDIDPVWDVLPFVNYPPHCHDVVYGKETIDRCISEPKIIHFGGTWRPWKGPGRHWKETEFYRYLYRTAWRNDVYCAPWMGRGNTPLTKAKQMLKKVLKGRHRVREP